MRPIAYSLQFRGQATPFPSDRVRLRLTAPSAVFVTTIDASGVRGRFEDASGDEAVLDGALSLRPKAGVDFGAIDFGRSNTIGFRSHAARLVRCPDPHLRHGAVIREVGGGEGQFAGAVGIITANFFISDTGEVTENQLGLIFVRHEET